MTSVADQSGAVTAGGVGPWSTDFHPRDPSAGSHKQCCYFHSASHFGLIPRLPGTTFRHFAMCHAVTLCTLSQRAMR